MSLEPRRKKSTDKRDALVSACAELFWTKGYGETSLADISEKSGVALGNIYYYFRSKSEMADAVASVFVEETGALVAAVSGQAADPRERLALLVNRLAQTSKSRIAHGCPIGTCIRSFRAESPQASARASEAFGLLIGFIARELGKRGVRPSLALSSARAAIVEWQGGIVLAHALGDPAVLSESFRRMERLLVT